MTADLSEGETESRQLNPSSTARSKGETPVGPSDRLKGGRWKDAKEVELGERVRDVDSENDCRGTPDLTTGFKDGVKGRPELVNHDATSVQGTQRGARLPSRESKKVEVLSSEGYRDMENEDDFVEGDGTVPEVVSDSKRKQQDQQQQSPDQAQKSQRIELQEKVPQPAQNPVSSAGWESFLPQSNIKILLAEDDDSTRQVVGALLRNCSYEGTSRFPYSSRLVYYSALSLRPVHVTVQPLDTNLGRSLGVLSRLVSGLLIEGCCSIPGLGGPSFRTRFVFSSETKIVSSFSREIGSV